MKAQSKKESKLTFSEKKFIQHSMKLEGQRFSMERALNTSLADHLLKSQRVGTENGNSKHCDL